MSTSLSPLATVKKALQAYADKDRAAIESVIAADYHFTSPIDNALDRAMYFQTCWPNSATTDRVDLAHGFEDGERAVVVYELTSGPMRFRNCEMHTVRAGKLVATEVFFGWDVPHRVPDGQHSPQRSRRSRLEVLQRSRCRRACRPIPRTG